MALGLAAPRLASASSDNDETIAMPVFSGSVANIYESASQFPRYDITPIWAGKPDSALTDAEIEERDALTMNLAPLVRNHIARTLQERTGQVIPTEFIRVLFSESAVQNTKSGDVAWQVELPNGAAWKGRCVVRTEKVITESYPYRPRDRSAIGKNAVQIDYWTVTANQLEQTQFEQLQQQRDRSSALRAFWDRFQLHYREQFDDWLTKQGLDVVTDTTIVRFDPEDLDRIRIAVTARVQRRGAPWRPWWKATNIVNGHFSVEVPAAITSVDIAREFGEDYIHAINDPLVKIEPTKMARRARHYGQLHRMPTRTTSTHAP